MSGRPGPTYLDIPSDVLNSQIASTELPQLRTPQQPRHSTPSSAAIQQAAAAVQGAKRPLIVIGHGALMTDAAAVVRRLADSAGIPVLCTPMARGVLPDDHPLSATAARTIALGRCDVALLVGAPLNWQLHHGLPPKWSEGVRFVAIDNKLAPYDVSKTEVPYDHQCFLFSRIIA